MFFKTIILYKIIFDILKLSMFILVSVDFFFVVLEEVSGNRLQAVRLSVIDYNIPIIDYRASMSINSKFQKPRECDFCRTRTQNP